MNPLVFTDHSVPELVALLCIAVGLICVFAALANLFRLQPMLDRQHRRDLETLLAGLIDERDALDEQIEAVTHAILRDLEHRDAQAKPGNPIPLPNTR